MQFSLSFSDIYPTLFLLARVGAMLMVLPGFGEVQVNSRIRVMLAITLCIVLSKIIEVPAWTVDSPLFMQTLLKEVGIGLMLGIIARLWLVALQLTANIISLQMGFSNAVMFNPAMATQDSVVSAGLMVTATSFIFVADIHHKFIAAVVESYHLFPLAQEFLWADFSIFIKDIVAHTFVVGVQLSIPFLVLGTIFQIGLGFLNRLMPQMQIFFLAMPMQILGGMVVLALMGSVIVNVFMGTYDDLYSGIKR